MEGWQLHHPTAESPDRAPYAVPGQQQSGPSPADDADFAESDEVLDAVVENAARVSDANDLLYQIEASRDYDPGPSWRRFAPPLYAINTADDFLESSRARHSRARNQARAERARCPHSNESPRLEATHARRSPRLETYQVAELSKWSEKP
jgi:hypothetical protein